MAQVECLEIRWSLEAPWAGFDFLANWKTSRKEILILLYQREVHSILRRSCQTSGNPLWWAWHRFDNEWSWPILYWHHSTKTASECLPRRDPVSQEDKSEQTQWDSGWHQVSRVPESKNFTLVSSCFRGRIGRWVSQERWIHKGIPASRSSVWSRCTRVFVRHLIRELYFAKDWLRT